MYQQAIDLLKRGRPQEAIKLLQQGLVIKPNDPALHTNLAIAYEEVGDAARAERGYRFILSQWPKAIEAKSNLANLLVRLGRLDEAAQFHQTVLQTNPNDAYSLSALGLTLIEQARIEEAVALFKRSAEVQGTPAAWSNYLFYSLHAPGDHAAEHQAWADRFAAPLKQEPSIRRWDRKRPLRVGYVSPYFREHTVSRFFEPILENHNRERVVAVCYSDVRTADPATRRLRTFAAEWRDTARLDDEQLAQLIRRDGIDVLVDLTGHLRGSRLLAFARNPAPILLSYIGYPLDSGVTTNIDTAGWAYKPSDAPPVAPLPADINGHVTFGAFNRAAKITAEVAATWAAVLSAVPNSRLAVLALGGEANKAVRERLTAAGIATERISIFSMGSRMEYLQLCDRIDIHLDPFPYNGMTTTCDLLWQGVPTITLLGSERQATVGARLLHSADLWEFVALTQADYVRAARELAADLGRLRQLRSSLRARLQASPLLDAKGAAERIESLYLTVAKDRLKEGSNCGPCRRRKENTNIALDSLSASR